MKVEYDLCRLFVLAKFTGVYRKDCINERSTEELLERNSETKKLVVVIEFVLGKQAP